MSDEPLVSVERVGKRFCRSLKRSLWYGVRDICSEFNVLRKSGLDAADSTKLRKEEFWALNDVSFELRRGECVGLIGRNGAGKTTLLRILNGLIKPDRGQVTMRGRVGALIALGAGFNPILTGRENIYVNGSVLGLSKREIDAKVDDIIGFAEIGEFIDSPVQSYSSGMYVRLGFAVASALSPDILLVDEVLAVGDTLFRAKCFRRIDALRRKAAVILVSHQMDQIGVACSRVLVMDHGSVACDGPAEVGIEAYERLNRSGGEESGYRHLADAVAAVKVEVPETFSYGEAFRATLVLDAREALLGFHMRVRLRAEDGTLALEVSSAAEPISLAGGRHRVEVKSHGLYLRPGNYQVSVDGFCSSRLEALFHLSRSYRTNVTGKVVLRGGYVQYPAILTVDNANAASLNQ